TVQDPRSMMVTTLTT
nr:immunoglobulin heavy chain junction region [Mus musculus]